MKKAVVTGANGFVGSNLIQELITRNYLVYAVVRNRNSKINNILLDKRVKIVYCELENIRDLPIQIGEEVQYFYHFAWTGTSGSEREDYKLQLNNVRYTCDTVKAASELKCIRFLNAGSIMEYEAKQYISDNGVSPGAGYIYSTAKLAADYMAKIVAVNLNMEYINYLISNIYGEGEFSARFINTTIRKMLKKDRLSFTEGKQQYDFIYITDAVKAMCMIAEKGSANSEYYIGNDEIYLLKEYIVKIRDIVDKTLPLYFGEIAYKGPTFNCYDEINRSRIQEELGFIVQVDFETGIKKTKDWIEMYG